MAKRVRFLRTATIDLFVRILSGRPARGSGLKSHRAEAVPIYADALLRHPFAHEPRGDGCQKNSATKVARCHEQAVEVGGSEDGQMIWRVGSDSCPGLLYSCACKAGRQLDRSCQDLFDAACRQTFLEACIFHGCSGEDSSVISRPKIDFLGPKNSLDVQIVRAESHHLAFRGPHRRVRGYSFDVCGKATSCDDGPLRLDLFVFQMQTKTSPAFAPNCIGAAPRKKLHAALPCRFQHS